VPTRTVHLPGGRDARASLDRADDSAADAVVVACPPHPRHGGSRHDPRLEAVAAALPARIDCIRIAYGPWDEGRGERDDARAACAWAADRYDAVGLFGYSFGGGVALLTAADVDTDAGAVVAAVAALAPVARLPDGSDVPEAVATLAVPHWIGSGRRDETVDAAAVAGRADERRGTVARFPAGHAFVGQEATVGDRVARFFEGALSR
jgi:alpha/beta superfamily hydrolase